MLTSTPVKRLLEDSAAAKSKNKAEKSQPRCKKSIFPVNTQHHESESDSETSDPNMELDDSDSDLLPSDLEPQEREDGEIENPTAQQLDEGDYVLVKMKFDSKKISKYYIGKVESVESADNTVDCMFLKRKPTKEGQFLVAFTKHLDASEVSVEDILCKLANIRGNHEDWRHFYFSIQFHKFFSISHYVN